MIKYWNSISQVRHSEALELKRKQQHPQAMKSTVGRVYQTELKASVKSWDFKFDWEWSLDEHQIPGLELFPGCVHTQLVWFG